MNRILAAPCCLLVLGLFADALSATPLFAADMSRRAPVYKATPAPIDYFSGLFLGAEVGYAWGKGDTSGVVSPLAIPDYDTDSVAGSLNLTYRWRTAPNGYVGITTSIDSVDLKDTNVLVPVFVSTTTP